MRNFKIFFACFFWGLNSFTQQTNFSFQKYTMQDGLSDNYIRNVYQDDRGYIWICTNEGLNRFDGTQFQRFFHNANDSTTISSNFCEKSIQQNKNKLLIQTFPSASLLDLTHRTFSKLNDKIAGIALSVNEDKYGNTLLGFADKIVLADSGLNFKKSYPLEKTENNSPINVHRLNDGKIAVVTSSGVNYLDENTGRWSSIQWFDTGNKTKEYYFSYSFYHSASNTLYAGGWTSGLYKLNFSNKTVTNLQEIANSPLYAIPVNTVFKDSHDRLWIGTTGGLILYDENSREKKWLTKTTDNDGLSENHIRCITEDHENNLWIGTINGLNKLSNQAQSIRYFRKEFELNNRYAEIYDITRLSNNDIIIATYGNGLFKLDELSGKIIPLQQPYMTHTWTVSEMDNKLFAGGHQQLIVADLNNYRFSPVDFLKPYYKNTDLVLIAQKDHSGEKWFSMNGGKGLLRLKAGSDQLIHYYNQQSPIPFPHNYFNVMAEDSNGNIWWGVNKFSELVKWNHADESFEIIDPVKIFNKPGKIRKGINCFFYENGHLWIGTDGAGLYDYEINSGKIREFGINEGLCGENIAQVIADKKNRLWIGTRKGLSCLLADRRTFINFTTASGLPEIIFNDGACMYDSAKNNLYLATQYSLLIINPDELLSHRSGQVKVYLDEIYINGTKNPELNEPVLTLKYYQNNIQFNFSIVEFDNAADLLVTYKLDGIGNEWIPISSQRTITFLNLGDGKYSFRLRVKKSGTDQWNEMEAPFRFNILPPFWKTWWFITLLCIFSISFFLFIIKFYYRRKIEQQKLLLEKKVAIEAERSRIAADMHDDLGAGITRIKFLAEDIEEHLPSNADKSGVENLKRSSNELVDKMSEIIWAMNEKNNSWEDLVFYLRSYSVQYCQENKIICNFLLPENIPNASVSGETRRNVFLTIKECLHNVVKHATAKNVLMAIRFDKKCYLHIQDDGKGFDLKDNIKTGNGIISMRKRIEGLNGKIEFVNNKGTAIYITIPI